jgi:hypothetical protein
MSVYFKYVPNGVVIAYADHNEASMAQMPNYVKVDKVEYSRYIGVVNEASPLKPFKPSKAIKPAKVVKPLKKPVASAKKALQPTQGVIAVPAALKGKTKSTKETT